MRVLLLLKSQLVGIDLIHYYAEFCILVMFCTGIKYVDLEADRGIYRMETGTPTDPDSFDYVDYKFSD